jgi:hypothetical protein
MSSPSPLAVKRGGEAAAPKRPRRAATEPLLSATAKQLAAHVEKALARGELDALAPDALQALMAAGCKLYTAQVEAGRGVLPLGQRGNVTPTEVMTTTSGMLRAVNLAVFELGMWQSWTGR